MYDDSDFYTNNNLFQKRTNTFSLYSIIYIFFSYAGDRILP